MRNETKTREGNREKGESEMGREYKQQVERLMQRGIDYERAIKLVAGTVDRTPEEIKEIVGTKKSEKGI